jgi:phosphoglycolate phosphatase
MEISRIDSAIFDLDGTLWDASITSAWAWNRALRDLKIEFREITAGDIRSISGRVPEEFLPMIFPDLGGAKRLEVYDLCSRYEISDIRKMGGIMYEGVPKGICDLSEQIPVTLVSNCQADYMEAFLEWTGMDDIIFDYLSFGENGLDKKSNIEEIVNRCDLRDPVFIGDTTGDRKAAEDAGIPFLGAGWGFGKEFNDPVVFQNFNELKNFILDKLTVFPSKPLVDGLYDLSRLIGR